MAASDDRITQILQRARARRQQRPPGGLIESVRRMNQASGVVGSRFDLPPVDRDPPPEPDESKRPSVAIVADIPDKPRG